MIETGSGVTEFTIIGAGIAGLSVADELLKRNQSVTIIDKDEPGSGSSGAPLVLINPATGRRAKMVKNARECVHEVSDLLERVENHSGATFFEKNGVLRPALDEELAKDFKRSPTKYSWPDTNWIQWLGTETFRDRFSYFGEQHGGLVLNYGYTVNAPLYLKYLTDYLVSKGLKTRFNSLAEISEHKDSTFKISLEKHASYHSKNVICATGSSIKKDPLWNFLPAKTTKGQLLDLTFDSPLPLYESISSMGYFAHLPSEPNRLVVGSTYEHSYDNLETDDKAKNYLYKKLDRTLPGLSSRPHSVQMWSGERISMKDHKPAVGEHPLSNNRYLLSGLGSKGMIQGRYLAKQLVEFILDGKPIAGDFNLNRFQSF